MSCCVVLLCAANQQTNANANANVNAAVNYNRWHNVVSTTTTIEANFGSGVAVRGFMLNNELTDFDPVLVDEKTRKRIANGPEGGKKLRRSAR